MKGGWCVPHKKQPRKRAIIGQLILANVVAVAHEKSNSKELEKKRNSFSLQLSAPMGGVEPYILKCTCALDLA